LPASAKFEPQTLLINIVIVLDETQINYFDNFFVTAATWMNSCSTVKGKVILGQVVISLLSVNKKDNRHVLI